ncbi:MAG: hypothetical protein ACREM2_12415, partial [Vulcanimicrobiaceae bacterium]
VYLNDATLHSRGPIAIRVITNETVAKVVSRSGGHGGALTQVGPGEFVAQSTLPAIPFLARGSQVELEFVAYGPTGKTVTVDVPVTLQ